MNKYLIDKLHIQNLILEIRGEKVMLDVDLARLYRVSTRVLNQQVKRNIERFPDDFMFQLTREERNAIDTQTVSKYTPSRPYVFTEHGALMLASVLKSEVAVSTSIEIVRAFSRMRTMLAANKELAEKIDEIERKVSQHDEKFKAVFEAIRNLILPDKTGAKPVGFHVNIED